MKLNRAHIISYHSFHASISGLNNIMTKQILTHLIRPIFLHQYFDLITVCGLAQQINLYLRNGWRYQAEILNTYTWCKSASISETLVQKFNFLQSYKASGLPRFNLNWYLAFCEAPVPQGCLRAKSCIFWQGHSKLIDAKMPNSNFLFSGLGFTSILWHFAEHVTASRLPGKKKCTKAKNLRAGPTTSPNSNFWFLALGPPAGTRAAHRVCPLTKQHRITKCLQPIWARCLLWKKDEIPKFLLLGQPAWPFGQFFSGCGPKIKILVPTFFCLVALIPKRYDTIPSLKNPEMR